MSSISNIVSDNLLQYIFVFWNLGKPCVSFYTDKDTISQLTIQNANFAYFWRKRITFFVLCYIFSMIYFVTFLSYDAVHHKILSGICFLLLKCQSLSPYSISIILSDVYIKIFLSCQIWKMLSSPVRKRKLSINLCNTLYFCS